MSKNTITDKEKLDSVLNNLKMFYPKVYNHILNWGGTISASIKKQQELKYGPLNKIKKEESYKIVCNERGCGDPYGKGWDCHTCLKR